MACTRPVTAYRSRAGRSANGNWPIVFNMSDGIKDMQVQIPCGRCVDCRLEYSRAWASRCVLESKNHDANSFITLTYDNDHLPEDGSISKKEVQDFMKRLRINIKRSGYDKEIRYFACGEYGDKFSRPHYHLCIFGYDFPDKQKYNGKRFSSSFSTYKGETNIYRSEMLEKTWTKGFSSIGKLTYESAAYVARYVVKKITGDKAEEHYKGKEPEFALMSRKPGLGRDWIDKNIQDVINIDKVMVRPGLQIKTPKYYNNIIEKTSPEVYEKLKLERRKKIKDIDIHERYRLDNSNEVRNKKRKRSFER